MEEKKKPEDGKTEINKHWSRRGDSNARLSIATNVPSSDLPPTNAEGVIPPKMKKEEKKQEVEPKKKDDLMKSEIARIKEENKRNAENRLMEIRRKEELRKTEEEEDAKRKAALAAEEKKALHVSFTNEAVCGEKSEGKQLTDYWR